MAEEFAALVAQLWDERAPAAVAPRDFKRTLAQCAAQFAGARGEGRGGCARPFSAGRAGRRAG